MKTPIGPILTLASNLCWSTALTAIHVQVHSATITTANGAGADTFIAAFEQDTNYGNLATLNIKNAMSDGVPSISFNRKGYIRFDISALGSSSIAGATLSLTIGNGVEGDPGDPVTGVQLFSIYGLNDVDSGENWVESALTWNNAPANDTSSGSSVLSNTSLLGQFSFTGTGNTGSFAQLSGGNLVNFLSDDTNSLVTFILVRETFDPNYHGWIHNFASKENLTLSPPSLTITQVPEPSSVVLLGLGIAALVYRTKSKWSNAA